MLTDVMRNHKRALDSAATGGSDGHLEHKGERLGVGAKRANDKCIWKYPQFNYTIFDLTAFCFG
jgi:hypothetical protein